MVNIQCLHFLPCLPQYPTPFLPSLRPCFKGGSASVLPSVRPSVCSSICPSQVGVPSTRPPSFPTSLSLSLSFLLFPTLPFSPSCSLTLFSCRFFSSVYPTLSLHPPHSPPLILSAQISPTHSCARSSGASISRSASAGTARSYPAPPS